MPDDQETPLHRYMGMVMDMQDYLDYTVEMEKLATQMNACGKQTKAYASLSWKYDAFRVARENHWEKCATKYGVANVEAFSHAMRAFESEMCRQVAVEQERHQPQPKKPLLDFYTTEHSPSEGVPQDTDISDQKMKKWLEERIVRLELYRSELDSIGEQIEALDQHADYLQGKGQPVPLSEQQQRETLEGAYLSKQEEMRRAFEPTASMPFSVQEEMKVYCQMLSEVNERLKQQEPQHQPAKRALRDLYSTDTERPEQPGQRDEPERSR